ncbi:uroporphyrinogen-III C-methyltransferase [Arthrobacter sp. SDTb3-6]|uniref:uroporphyrinogen-III C-methyltransferase n=1 Tax=Arthrobacter sp. SDTb3-6 TaxID=2713571 RepID=UPI00210B12B2|nr:uroporphyrinogen-III C-methyltransferase [Arthrobacter sp. SDTb3-6]
MMKRNRTGRITLVGGGPGPADLLTVRAVKALATADVVYFDRLGPTRDLAELAPHATFVDVGKTPGHHKVPQEEIQARMVDGARAGLHVVRLKGGDPFVFGRGGEEVAAAVAAGIPVSVVPGVSSAVAVPGAAGIPVTHRNVSHLFTVVSGHAPLEPHEYRHLAGLGGTIVVLMGIGTLPSLVAGLRLAGLSGGTPVAVVERGFSHTQRTTAATLGSIVTAATACRNPAVIVIGDVVSVAGGAHQAAADFLPAGTSDGGTSGGGTSGGGTPGTGTPDFGARGIGTSEAAALPVRRRA